MKTLRAIIAAGLLASNLLFLGCPPKVDVKKVSEAVTGQTNAYDEAVKIAQNPSSVVTGDVSKNIPSIQLEPKSDKSLVEKTDEEISKPLVKEEAPKPLKVGDYFFQGKELHGLISPSPSDLVNYFLSTPKFVEFEEKFEWLCLNGLQERQTGAYSFPNGRISIEHRVAKFETEKDNWKFLKELEKTEDGLVFVNKNFSSFISFSSDLNLSEEKIVVNSLINYAKRIGGEFYRIKQEENIAHQIERYNNLGIPIKESAKYLAEALEFQKKMYNLDKLKFNDFFIKNWILNP